MKHGYDDFGWYCGPTDGERAVDVVPPVTASKTVGQPYPNWTGTAWVMVVYAAPAQIAAPAAPVDPCLWLIDIGPFMDRFGAAKMAVLVATDAATKAIVQDMMVRKWIDLKRPDVGQALDYIGSVVPALTATLRASILTTPVTAAENLALRKLYFSK